jgi:hypothetical protein
MCERCDSRPTAQPEVSLINESKWWEDHRTDQGGRLVAFEAGDVGKIQYTSLIRRPKCRGNHDWLKAS